ncbi:MAG: hypothetical protein U0271_34730 [Polyangiaceae bacterium]
MRTARILGSTLLVFGCAVVTACSSEPTATSSASSAKKSAAPAPSPSPSVSSPAPSASSSVAAAAAKPLADNAVSVESMNLAFEPPKGVKGSAHELRDSGTAVVEFVGYDLPLSIGRAHGDLEHVKEKRAKEEGFVKWLTETADSAVAEVEVSKKKEYYGFAIKTVGGELFECGTMAKQKRTSPNEKAVRASLALCDSLRPLPIK